MDVKRITTAALAALILTGCGSVEMRKKDPSDSAAHDESTFPTESGEVPVNGTAVSGKQSGKKKSTDPSAPAEEETPGTADEALPAQPEQQTYQPEQPRTQQPEDTQPAYSCETPQTPAATEQSVTQHSAPAETSPPARDPDPEPEDPRHAEKTPEEPSEPARGHRLSVACIMQRPELPTGCEVTSLAILLNALGYPADKLELSRNYLPKMQFYYEDGVLHGADFRTAFAGDPESEYSYGCWAPCIVTAANAYLSAVGAGASARDITGTPLESLFGCIDSGVPVMIWITSDGLLPSAPSDVWTTPGGYTVQWLKNEHCVVLTGYDPGSGLVYVSDPLVGNTSYDMTLLNARYAELGQQCVIIE